MTALGTTGTFWYSTDATSWTQKVNTNGIDQISINNTFYFDFQPLQVGGSTPTHTGPLYIAFVDPSSTGVPIALADGDILQYNSTDSKFKPVQLGVDDLSDIDTSTVAPTDGQALVWDNTNSQWEPGTISGGVTSVNTQTGAVSLGVEDLDDYLAQPGTHPIAYHSDKQAIGDWSGSNSSTTGGYSFDNPINGDYTKIYINKNYATSGTTLAAQGFSGTHGGGTTLDLWVSADGVTFTQHTATITYDQSSNNALFLGLSPNLNAYTSASALYFSLTAPGTPAPLADGDILQYESSTSKFRPVQLGVDDLSDVDTSTVAPTDGQALLWDNTAQKWEPGTVSGDGGDAATLDSLDSTQFLRSDTADTKTSGDLNFSDNVSATFGTGADLDIYHNGSSSYIDNDTGDLKIRQFTANRDVSISADNGSGAPVSYFVADGSSGEAQLFHYGSQKLNTIPDGIELRGLYLNRGLGASSANGYVIDLAASGFWVTSINGNVTLTFSNPPAFNKYGGFALQMNYTSGVVTWPTTVKWPNDTAPTLTASKKHMFVFTTTNGGSVWRGAYQLNYSS